MGVVVATRMRSPHLQSGELRHARRRARPDRWRQAERVRVGGPDPRTRRRADRTRPPPRHPALRASELAVRRRSRGAHADRTRILAQPPQARAGSDHQSLLGGRQTDARILADPQARLEPNQPQARRPRHQRRRQFPPRHGPGETVGLHTPDRRPDRVRLRIPRRPPQRPVPGRRDRGSRSWTTASPSSTSPSRRHSTASTSPASQQPRTSAHSSDSSREPQPRPRWSSVTCCRVGDGRTGIPLLWRLLALIVTNLMAAGAGLSSTLLDDTDPSPLFKPVDVAGLAPAQPPGHGADDPAVLARTASRVTMWRPTTGAGRRRSACSSPRAPTSTTRRPGRATRCRVSTARTPWRPGARSPARCTPKAARSSRSCGTSAHSASLAAPPFPDAPVVSPVREWTRQAAAVGEPASAPDSSPTIAASFARAAAGGAGGRLRRRRVARRPRLSPRPVPLARHQPPRR